MIKKLLLVDAGGILFKNITEDTPFFHEVSKELRVDKYEFLRIYESYDNLFEVDDIDVKEVLRIACSRLNGQISKLDELAWLNEIYLKCCEPNVKMFSYLKNVKEKNIIPTSLANNEARYWDEIKNQRYHHFSLFKYISSSWIVKCVKPTNQYFQNIVSELNLDLKDIMLVDDNHEIIQSASLLGIDCIHYKNFEDTLKQLNLYGINI